MTAKSNIIRQFISSVLLIVFTFSITPKKLLHDVITKHKHTTFDKKDNGIQINQQSFNCACDSIVAESPFVENNISILISPVILFFEQPQYISNHFYSFHYFFKKQRGPPLHV